MSPLKIEILLRLRAYRDPFDGYTAGQRHSNAMRSAFADFHEQGLVQDWVTLDHEFRQDDASTPRLTDKGLDLVRRLMEVNP